MKERSADNDLKLEPNCFTGNSGFSRVLLGTKISKNTFAMYTEGTGETELFLIKGSHELPVWKNRIPACVGFELPHNQAIAVGTEANATQRFHGAGSALTVSRWLLTSWCPGTNLLRNFILLSIPFLFFLFYIMVRALPITKNMWGGCW